MSEFWKDTKETIKDSIKDYFRLLAWLYLWFFKKPLSWLYGKLFKKS